MLKKEDFAVLDQVGSELQSSISELINQLPKSAQTISGLSKFLGINRSNSQRLLNAVNKGQKDHNVLDLLPGVAGIKEFISACGKSSLKHELISNADSATNRFEAIIKQFSRSHSELKRIIAQSKRTTQNITLPKDRLQQRKIQFEATNALLGEKTKVLFGMYILTQNQADPSYLKEFALISKQGVHNAIHARPFFQYYSHSNEPDFHGPEILDSNAKATGDKFHVAIAKDFTSPCVIEGYSRYSQNTSSLLFENIADDEQPFDATFIFSNPNDIKNPLNSNTNSSSTAINIKNPTERLIMMVFIDRELDIRSTVSVGCYASNRELPEAELSAKETESDKLPEHPELRIVPPNSPLSRVKEDLQYGHLSDYLFRYSDLDRDNFVCYLIDVSYPIWSSCYRLYFEHS